MSSGVADHSVASQDARAASAAAGSADGRRHDADGAAQMTSQDERAPEAVAAHGGSQAADVTTLQHQERAQQQQQPDGAGSRTAHAQREYMAEYQQRYPASYHEAEFADDGDGSGD
jgi:hypothetical protein